MKIMKKVLALFLGTSVLLASVSGCGSADQFGKNTKASITEITYWDSVCTDMLPGSYCENLIENQFPIDLIVNRADDKNINQVTELLTEKNVPDVFWTNESEALIESFGITRSIPRAMVEEHAPSFLALYDTYPTIYTSIMNLDNTEEFFALNGATEQSAAIACSLYADYYRYDWIENLGIDLGVEVTQISDSLYVANTGLTLDKFEEVMHAFTYGDPDQDGLDNTIGASFEGMSRFDLLYSGFDMINGINEENGEAEYFYTTDNFKEFSVWFSDLFDKGYIDADFFHQDITARKEKVNNNEVGYFLESSIAINSWASDRPPLTLIESNPEVKLLITPGLSDNEGNATIIKNAMPTFGSLCYISKNVDDEKLIQILQMLEYINFGEDTISLWFGEEGVDWRYNDDGRVENISNLLSSEKGARTFVKNVMVGDLFHEISVEPIFEAGADFWLYDCIWRENDREQYPYKLDLLKETNYAKSALLYDDKCTLIYQKYFEDWVYHGLDVEESWESYMGELDNSGYHIMMGELDLVEPLEDMILNFTS
ncbi:MAG: hypothetical protein R3Y53_09265 [Bacillota bacterium]